MRLFAAICIIIAGAGHGALAEEDSDHVGEAAGLRILHAWTNATDGTVAEVYMLIENGSETVQTLTGAETAVADEIALVATAIRAAAEAERIEALPVEPGAELPLEPGGLFFMLSGLDRSLAEGDSFSMEIHLDPAGQVEIEVQVESQDATAHSHAGHSH